MTKTLIELTNAFTKIFGGIIIFPILVTLWILWGAWRGICVWAWNVNHSKIGEWKFNIPEGIKW